MLTLVLGGARSGKSRHAQALCEGRGDVVFIATASAENDPEMASRILRHRDERPPHWKTIEAPLDPVAALRELGPRGTVVLVDCITLWISNLLYEHRALDPPARESRILAEVRSLSGLSRGRELVLVSNEVGGGLVPETGLGREFRDLQGRANQLLAEAASRVVWMVAGIPVSIKDQRESSPPST